MKVQQAERFPFYPGLLIAGFVYITHDPNLPFSEWELWSIAISAFLIVCAVYSLYCYLTEWLCNRCGQPFTPKSVENIGDRSRPTEECSESILTPKMQSHTDIRGALHTVQTELKNQQTNPNPIIMLSDMIEDLPDGTKPVRLNLKGFRTFILYRVPSGSRGTPESVNERIDMWREILENAGAHLTFIFDQAVTQDQVKDLQNSEPSGAVAKPLTSDAQEPQSERSTYSLVFTAPENGATVSQFVKVQYSQVGNVPSGMHTILVVQDPIEQFWSLGSVYPNLSKRIQVGIPKDIGVTFHIGLLVTDREFPISRSRRELPEYIHYQSIEVHRR